MTDGPNTRAGNEEEIPPGQEEDEEYAPTPFDNPFFLPVMLLVFCVWFIYDGWFNADMEYIRFNQVGAGVTLVLGVYFTLKAFKERSADPS